MIGTTPFQRGLLVGLREGLPTDKGRVPID